MTGHRPCSPGGGSRLTSLVASGFLHTTPSRARRAASQRSASSDPLSTAHNPDSCQCEADVDGPHASVVQGRQAGTPSPRKAHLPCSLGCTLAPCHRTAPCPQTCHREPVHRHCGRHTQSHGPTGGKAEPCRLGEPWHPGHPHRVKEPEPSPTCPALSQIPPALPQGCGCQGSLWCWALQGSLWCWALSLRGGLQPQEQRTGLGQTRKGLSAAA